MSDPSAAPDIDLWLTYYPSIQNPAILDRFGALLSDEERQQQQRFLFAQDRLRYLVTRAMVRTVLSRYATVAPFNWQFSRNEFGRPLIACLHNLANLTFNISHTDGLIVLAVSQQGEVGVDVERIKPRTSMLDIADEYFAADEAADLAQLPAHLQQDRFFGYWTLKESYIKARGMGLSLPLQKFSFHFVEPSRVTLALEPDINDNASRWHFRLCRPSPEHILSLCSERIHGRVPSVAAHLFDPELMHEAVDINWLATSE